MAAAAMLNFGLAPKSQILMRSTKQKISVKLLSIWPISLKDDKVTKQRAHYKTMLEQETKILRNFVLATLGLLFPK
jgi:hypothetical protein